jgi:PKD repeat protein
MKSIVHKMGREKGKCFTKTMIVSFIFLLFFINVLTIPVSATPKPIYGYAKFSDNSPANGATVTVTSDSGTRTTTVGPAGGWNPGYWQVDVGDPGQNWTEGTSFTVTITSGNYEGSGSGTVTGNYTDVADITLTYQGGSSGGGGTTPTNQAPVADAGGPYTRSVNTPITFSGTGSTDSDGEITSYEWDLGDGTTKSGSTITHTYTAQGNYTITLTVTDNDGAQGTDTTKAYITESTIQNIKPIADPDIPTKGLTNRSLSFSIGDSYDPDGLLIYYIWNFDDGSVIEGEDIYSPEHTYSKEGDYTVTLTVRDNRGEESSKSTIVTIYDPTTTTVDSGTLIDTDGDGTPDEFYNETTQKAIPMKKNTDGTFLIDVNDDGVWDYVYDPVSGQVTTYEPKEEDDGETPWLLIIGIGAVIVIAVIIFILFKYEIIYFEEAEVEEKPPKK